MLPHRDEWPSETAMTQPTETTIKQPDQRMVLAIGGLAALLASTCCIGPLLLVMLGFSGAWIGNLSALEPYRPIFILLAVLALALAWRRIFRSRQACRPDELCAAPRIRTAYKFIYWLVAALVMLALVFPYLIPLFY